MIWLHTATVYPSEETTDDYGNVERRPSATGTTTRATFQGRSAAEANTEDAATGRAVKGAVLFLPTTAPALDSRSAVEFDGERYEVDGDPITRYTPRGPHHVRVELRQVT